METERGDDMVPSFYCAEYEERSEDAEENIAGGGRGR